MFCPSWGVEVRYGAKNGFEIKPKKNQISNHEKMSFLNYNIIRAILKEDIVMSMVPTVFQKRIMNEDIVIGIMMIVTIVKKWATNEGIVTRMIVTVPKRTIMHGGTRNIIILRHHVALMQ